MTRRPVWAVGTCLALATLTACAGFASHPEPAGTALPSEVPPKPTYATAKAVVRDGPERTGAYAQMLVAAGNWYIRVMDPPSAPAIAKALHAVVLDAKGKGSKTPKYPLPDIPSTRTYEKADALADELAASVGCFQRETAPS
ncbi:hypothetical protein ABZT43_26370 [Streptomyces sp. NPDC005349]|uniref:hypothetical protein n=1 Tax=Streptomyces sp. NPDC005349 TaxID=3157037 RepID=UPI0033A4C869